MGKPQKQIPEFIQTAQAVLAQSDISARDDIDALKKGLPVLAAKMHQAGEDVTMESLTAAAQQGADFVRDLAERVTAGYNLHKALTYENIVQGLPKPPAETIHGSAVTGDLETLRQLHQQGGDIRAENDVAVRWAAYKGHLAVMQYLQQQGADMDLFSDWTKKQYQKYLGWSKSAGVPAPSGCLDFPPELFRDKNVQDCFQILAKALRSEGYSNGFDHKIAFPAAVLFGDDQTALRYLKAHGTAGKQPLHDVIYQLQFRKNPLDPNINWNAWRGAVSAHGPKMAKLFKFADKVTPVRSACGKNWLYHETLKEVAKHAYDKAAEHPELSALFLTYAMDNKDFNDALELVKKRENKAIKSNIPDIAFKMPNGLTYRKLADGDLRGLVLGEITDCCQTINNHGDKCVRHGFASENGGFYVVEDKKGEIIGQSWAWLGENDELVLDSLETLGKRISADEWKNLAEEFASHLEKSAPKVTALHIGAGGKTPRLEFNKSAAQPKDHKGYRDSKNQYRVWRR